MGTRRPLLMMLDSTLRRQLRKKTLWLQAALYLAIVFAAIFPVAIYSPGQPSSTIFHSLQLLNLAAAIYLPAYGASRMVDDLASGTLELMQVAGMPARKWIAFRFLAILAGYSLIWPVRLPLYSYVVSTGGATLPDILWGEAISGVVLIGCAQTSLLMARFSSVDGAAIANAIGLFCVANGILFLPRFAVLLIGQLAGYSVPPALQSVANVSKELSLLSYLFDPPDLPERQVTAAIGILLVLLLGATATFWLRRLLYIRVEPGSAEVIPLAKSPDVVTRPSRRVWDDAFAWQASEYYFPVVGKKRWGFWLTCIGILALGAVPRAAAPLQALLGIWMVFALASPGMVATGCAALEIKHSTLVSLAMLPVGGRAVYEGWKRGGDSRRSDAWIIAAFGFLVLLYRDPWTAPAWAVVALVGNYTLPPIMFTETLNLEPGIWRRILRSMLGIGGYWLFQLVNVLGVAIVFTVVTLTYRPRATRLMEQRFEAASAK